MVKEGEPEEEEGVGEEDAQDYDDHSGACEAEEVEEDEKSDLGASGDDEVY